MILFSARLLPILTASTLVEKVPQFLLMLEQLYWKIELNISKCYKVELISDGQKSFGNRWKIFATKSEKYHEIVIVFQNNRAKILLDTKIQF